MPFRDESWAEFAWWYLLPFGMGVVLMAAINKSILIFGFQNLYPPDTWDYIRICIHPTFAAVQEPFTSKFIPAIVIVYLANRRDRLATVRDRSLEIAALGGLTVGAVEAGSKMLDQVSLSFGALPPVLMHVVTGTLVATAVFRYADGRQRWRGIAVMLVAYIAAVIVHVIWNTRIAFWLAGWNPC